MSVVTSIIIQVSCAEDGFDYKRGNDFFIKTLNDFLEKENYFPLVELTDYMERDKHPQTRVFGGGYNYFLEKEFTDLFLSLPYKYPENVVLVLNPEDGATEVYRPITINDCECNEKDALRYTEYVNVYDESKSAKNWLKRIFFFWKDKEQQTEKVPSLKEFLSLKNEVEALTEKLKNEKHSDNN